MNARKKRRKELERPARDLKRLTRRWRRQGRIKYGQPILASTLNHLLWIDMMEKARQRMFASMLAWTGSVFEDMTGVKKEDIKIEWDDRSRKTP